MAHDSLYNFAIDILFSADAGPSSLDHKLIAFAYLSCHIARPKIKDSTYLYQYNKY